jgi:murein L,D-transpeptidase YcbB/YkuD
VEKIFKIFALGVIASGIFNFNPGLILAKQDISADRIINLVNFERSSSGLNGLAENNALENAAQMKAEDMAEHSYFSHTSPNGKNPWYWFVRAGYEYETAGENLAMNMLGEEETVGAWMDSTKHRKNVLDNHYTETGVGIAYGTYQDKEAVFIVQLFGSPKNSFFSALLKMGSAGNSIKELQALLNKAGYNPGLPDGKFGQQTKLAVIRFQRDKGLQSDGVVGPMTWALL